MGTDAAVLRLENLGKRFGSDRSPLFAGVELELRQGEYLAVMGESGVGKSTLLNLLAGLDAPDFGRVLLEGVDLASLDDDGITLLRRRAVGFVFQAFHLLPYLTVEQNVALPLDLLGVAEPERGQRTLEMLDAVGMAGQARQFAGEPTGNLDPRSAAQILQLLRAQVKRNAGAGLLITHSRTAAETADRILILDAGSLKPLERAG